MPGAATRVTVIVTRSSRVNDRMRGAATGVTVTVIVTRSTRVNDINAGRGNTSYSNCYYKAQYSG